MNLRNFAVWGVIVVVMIGIYSVLSNASVSGPAANKVGGDISYSTMLAKVDSGEIRKVDFAGSRAKLTTADGGVSYSTAPPNEDLLKRLEAKGVDVNFQRAEKFNIWSVLRAD
eukprot:gene10869-10673_t